MGMNEQPDHTTPEWVTNLRAFAKDAPTTRELAWELLKQTRNPAYVSLRYEFPVDVLEKALERIPDEKPTWKRIREIAELDRPGNFKRPGEILPETIQSERIPGEDDDKK